MHAMLLALLGLIAGTPAPVCACSCAIDPARQAPREAFQHADTVFTGTVVSVNDTLSRWIGGPVSVAFAVSEVWKGPEQARLVLKTGAGDGDCGIAFRAGDRYLIYASDGENDPLSGGGLAVNTCSRTAPVANAQEDLAVLGRGWVPPEQPAGANGRSAVRLLAVLGAAIVLGLWLRLRRRKSTT